MATVLLLAVWIGLAAGFLDLAILLIRNRWIENETIHLGEGFTWIIPAGVTALVLIPGLVLALVAGLRRGRASLDRAVWLLFFVGFLDLSAKLPLEFFSASLFSAGLAVQATRLISTRRAGFVRFARLTTPLLAGAVLMLALATTVTRAWSERRLAFATLPPPPPAAPNVLLIVWDTVRAQNVSLYGYHRPTTPNLQRLAARGEWFRHAFATSSWTLPSHASLFTGRWPHELSAGWTTPLDDREPTLAGRLSALGYDTAGFVANLDYLGRETGVARGFAHFDDYPFTAREVFTRYIGLGRKLDTFSVAMLVDKLWGGRAGDRPLVPISREHAKRAQDIDRAFLDWHTGQRKRHRPFFAFLNYNEAHTPYEVPDDSVRGFGIRPESWHDRLLLHKWIARDRPNVSPRDIQMASDIYDDCIAYLDRRLGALLDELERRGALDNTVVIVTADHGEHLGDHMLFFHGCSLYRQLVEVPLVVAGPIRAPSGQVIDEPVSLRDLPATVLDLAGLEQGGTFPGRSLARFWARPEGAPQPAFEPLLMELERPELLTNQGRDPAAKGPMKSLVAGGMHYIRSGDGREELYALKLDPAEKTNLTGFPEAQVSLEGFRGALRSMFQNHPPDEGQAARHAEIPSGENERAAMLPTMARPRVRGAPR